MAQIATESTVVSVYLYFWPRKTALNYFLDSLCYENGSPTPTFVCSDERTRPPSLQTSRTIRTVAQERRRHQAHRAKGAVTWINDFDLR